MTNEREKLTITLTGRAPVTIVKSDWPKIADAERWEGQYRQQSFRKWFLNVRLHVDGRAIVYGIYDTAYQGEHGRRGGELLEAGEDIPAAILRVAESLSFERAIADECIADLPAEDLT